jgi:hypothetical protein
VEWLRIVLPDRAMVVPVARIDCIICHGEGLVELYLVDHAEPIQLAQAGQVVSRMLGVDQLFVAGQPHADIVTFGPLLGQAESIDQLDRPDQLDQAG